MATYMSTVLARTSSDLLSCLSKIAPSCTSRVPLFTLSVPRHLDSPELSTLVSALTSLSDKSVGCLSATLPSKTTQRDDYISCSIAIFDSNRAVAFRSTIPGKQRVQVGRWHAMHEDTANVDMQNINKERVDWQDVMSHSTGDHLLPLEIRTLSRDHTNSVIYFTDDASEGLSRSLQAFSGATKLGLIGSSTPFVTGRPFTLFAGASVYSSGAVGLCLSSSHPSRISVDFPGLQALTGPLTVTSAEGNLIHSLDNVNPSRLLLSLLQDENRNAAPVLATLRSTTKEDQFYVGIIEKKDSTHQLCQTYTITSGDPSRGTLALAGDFAPPQGSVVQLYRLPANTVPDILSRYLPDSMVSNPPAPSRKLVFGVAPPDQLPEHVSDAVNDGADTVVIENTFLAASENGFVVDGAPGKKGESTKHPELWQCSVPGGSIGLEWDS